MAKRRTHDSDDLFLDREDDPIGLTSAFAPVKGAQSVEYDTDDEAIGLTQAFAPVVLDEDERSWSEEDKWTGFDWESYGDAGKEADSEGEAPEEEGQSPAEPEGEKAPEPDQAESEAEAEAEGESEAPAVDGGEAAAPKAQAVPVKSSGGKGKHARHAASEPELSPRMKRSRRTRRTLIVIVILLIVAIGALGYFMFRTFDNSQHEAAQQAQDQQAAPKEDIESAGADDAVETAAKLTDVPVLTSLLGMTSDEAVAAIGHGALITSNRDVTEKDSAIRTSLNVALTEEPADSKTGTPTVYLGLDKDGKVLQVGYSASASALGFGSLSFSDAVNGEHVVEKTLAKVGVQVPEGSAVLPADKKAYSTYATDGTTVVKERCSFEGDINVNGKDCAWSSVLSYDYTTQVVTGNLSDTVRIIYVYLTEKVDPPAEEEA